MRSRDDKKRQHITASAARLFASQPFHKVRLEDVAADAGVGKGTLYIYFSSKEDLYFSLMADGFAALVERVRRHLADESADAVGHLRIIVEELVDFALQNPQLFELMRTLGTPAPETKWEDYRLELTRLIERSIRTGIKNGLLKDAHPELTALYIPGFVRAAMLFGPGDLARDALIAHMMQMLENGIGMRDRPAASSAATRHRRANAREPGQR